MNLPFFVGLWSIVWHESVALAVIGACVAAAVFSAALVAEVPLLAPFVRTIRTIAIFGAVAGCIALVAYGAGVEHESTRCKLQFTAAQKAAVQRGTTARAGASRDVSSGLQHDPQDTDQ